MPDFQYIRAEARRCDQLEALLREALRSPSFCQHVANPKPPIDLFGSVSELLHARMEYLESPQSYATADGKIIYRQCRKDSRGLMDCVISLPIPCAELPPSQAKIPELIQPMVQRCMDFVLAEFGADLHYALLHLDEGYPHIHAFMIGSCQHMHPGMRAELVDNKRISDHAERIRRHKQGLRDFQDRFYHRVASKFGWQRSGWKRNARRIRDRRLYQALVAARELAILERRDDILIRIDKALGVGDGISPANQLLRDATRDRQA